MCAEPQAIPPKISPAAIVEIFRRRGSGFRNSLRAGSRVFLQPEYKRILSGLPVPQTDRAELSRLRRNARVLRAAAWKSFARVEKQRVICFLARGAGGLECVFRLEKSVEPTSGYSFAAKNVVEFSRRGHRFHHFEESAGVFVSLAVGTFRFCRRVCSCSMPA